MSSSEGAEVCLSWLGKVKAGFGFCRIRSLGQKLVFAAHTLEMNAAYLDNWIRVLRSDKRATFKHAADAQIACDYLVAASEAGQGTLNLR